MQGYSRTRPWGSSRFCSVSAFGTHQLRSRPQYDVHQLGGLPGSNHGDVELVRREVERKCRAIGRKLHLVVNYDGFQLDPIVSDAYFSMVTYLQNRYYETASRYTTSAFMRLKLGEALKERDVAPHVFETQAEAQASAERHPPFRQGRSVLA